jgi:hypothetical protein
MPGRIQVKKTVAKTKDGRKNHPAALAATPGG